MRGHSLTYSIFRLFLKFVVLNKRFIDLLIKKKYNLPCDRSMGKSDRKSDHISSHNDFSTIHATMRYRLLLLRGDDVRANSMMYKK